MGVRLAVGFSITSHVKLEISKTVGFVVASVQHWSRQTFIIITDLLVYLIIGFVRRMPVRQ